MSAFYEDEFIDAATLKSEKRRERLLAARKTWRTRYGSITSSKAEQQLWDSLSKSEKLDFALDKVRNARSAFLSYGDGAAASHLAQMEKALAQIIAEKHGGRAEDVLPYSDDILPKSGNKPKKAPASTHPPARVATPKQSTGGEGDAWKEYFIRQLAGYYMSESSGGKRSRRSGGGRPRRNYPR